MAVALRSRVTIRHRFAARAMRLQPAQHYPIRFLWTSLSFTAPCVRRRERFTQNFPPPRRFDFAMPCFASTAVDTSAVSLSDQAVQRLHQLSKQRGHNVTLRVLVESGGCSGFQYAFRLDETQKDDDVVIERDGVQLLVDEVTLDFIRGATVTYEQEMIRSSFAVVDNPNSEASCGCGVSFMAK